jgi:DNA mismatch repair ATPase MutS
MVDKDQLCSTYDSIEKIVGFINESSIDSEKVENYLRRIALLNTLDRKRFDSADIFLIKKLLLNYRNIVKHLNKDVKDNLDITFSSEELLKFLSLDGDNKEVFYLSFSYSDELSEVRKKISEIDKMLVEIKRKRFAEIIEQHNLDFRFRDFIIVKENIANKLDVDLVYKEVYDKTSLLVKPIFPKAFFDLHQDKETLLIEEQEIEKDVLRIITEKIIKDKALIKDYVQKIEVLDTLFAKARLANKYNMTKPLLSSKEHIELINGHYLPLANKCDKMGTVYTPLSSQFDNKTIVITGSNMGGKTMLLKTIGFMQVLSQMGFWVPADKFETSVFENISYIGEDLSEKVEGLSSFGFEIHNLSKAIKMFDKKSLLLIDEFAKTTNSIEAKAIIAAMLESFSKKENVSSFLSTHFMDLPEFEKVSFYKMKGLDYEEYKKYYDKEKQYSLSERIKLINTFMRYEIIKTGSKDRTYDAIKIAETLGLNEEIISYTKQYL